MKPQRVTVEITLDVDYERWAELADTKGMLASEVRAEIRHDVRRVVTENYRAAGLLVPYEEAEAYYAERRANRERERAAQGKHPHPGESTAQQFGNVGAGSAEGPTFSASDKAS